MGRWGPGAAVCGPPGRAESRLRDGEDAMQKAKLFGQAEGYLVGISAGAALSAALTIAQEAQFADKKIVTILPDRGERYMSTPLFQFE